MKISREVLNYLLFGVLTTVINIAVYAFMTKGAAFGYQTATVVAWVLAVLFAYYTNRKFVFKSHNEGVRAGVKSFSLFIYYRLLSLVIDFGVMYVFIEWWKIDDLVTKIIANGFVVVFNYITSKLHVFRRSGPAVTEK